MKNNQAKVINEIRSAGKIGLMTHKNGDGDAFGSLLGLRNILEFLGKEVVLFSNEPLPKFMKYLEKDDKYKPDDQYRNVDLLIMLDVGVEKRLTCPDVFKVAKELNARTAVIDHHAEGDIYDLVDITHRVMNTSSTSEMVFWISEKFGLRLDRQSAEFLLFGIETDTNFLTNPNAIDKKTYIAKSILLEYGAKTKKIKENIKEGGSLNDLRFLGKIIERSILDGSIGLLATFIKEEDFREYEIEPGVSSVVAGFLDQTKGAKIVLVAEQRDKNNIKVSMRSNNSNANVAIVASYFGGGGHIRAAGFEIEGNLDEILQPSGDLIFCK